MSQLEFFKQNLPKKPYCSNNLDYGLKIRNINNAVQYQYIQHEHINSKSYFTFDIDYELAISMFHDEFNVAIPNILVQNPVNHHAHVIYALETPIHLNASSSQKAIKYAVGVEYGYLNALRADLRYIGLVTKNPLHSYWNTMVLREDPYDLDELAEYIPQTQKYTKRRKVVDNYGLGRNCQLFDDLRRWAYYRVDDYRTNEGDKGWSCWVASITSEALRINKNFLAPLPLGEVTSIIKSVSRWVFDKYKGERKIRRGRDIIKSSLLPDLRDRQILSASETNKQRVNATEQKIKSEIMKLKSSHKKITVTSVSKATNLHRNTISKYKFLFK